MNDPRTDDTTRTSSVGMPQQQQQAAAAATDSRSNAVGVVIGKTRVRDAAGYSGTVRYVGPVATCSTPAHTKPTKQQHPHHPHSTGNNNNNDGGASSAKQPSQTTTTTTIYAGVEWDDPTRGRHDGSVLVCRTTGQRVRYFSCRRNSSSTTTTATAASFVKLALLDWGVPLTVVPLIQSRYVDASSAECVAPHSLLPHTAQTSSGANDKKIYLLGETTQIRRHQQIRTLTSLSLRLAGVSSISPTFVQDTQNGDCENDKNESGTNTSNNNNNNNNNNNIQPEQQQQRSYEDETRLDQLRDMDLAGNLLCDWQDVWNLLTALPLLQKLSVASNRLVMTPYNNTNNNETFPLLFFPNLIHLNLRATNLESIHTVLCVGRACPNLTELILAYNNNNSSTTAGAICDAEDKEDTEAAAATKNVPSMDAVHSYPQRFTLDELSRELATTFANLVFLDCSQCGGLLNHWEQDDCNALAAAWSQLPSLQTLSLDDNDHLTDFSVAVSSRCDNNKDELKETIDKDTVSLDNVPATASTLFYPALTNLQFSGTALDDWARVAAWHAALPNLTRLRLGKCPLTASKNAMNNPSSSAASCRRRILYLLPRLVTLNASTVTPHERNDSARLYYQRFFTTLPSPPPISTTMPSVTPHAAANKEYLCRVQDDFWLSMFPELGTFVRGGSPTSTANTERGDYLTVVNVTIRSFVASSCTQAPLVRRLPSHMTVGKLKALCVRQFGLDVDLQELRYRRNVADSLMEAMDGGDHSTLQDYGISDGADIVLHEKDVTAVAREQQRALLAQTERALRQEREAQEFTQLQKRVNH